MLNFFAFQWGYQMGIDGALKLQITDNFSARGNVAWGRCKGNGLQSGNYLLDTKEITDINTAGGVFCDHSQTMTSSAVVAYRFRSSGRPCRGQMLYGSGLRTSESEDAFTNSSHFQSWTIYNASITHVFNLPWDQQKMLVGFDVVNCARSEVLLQSRAKAVSGSGSRMRGCHGRSFSALNGSSKSAG